MTPDDKQADFPDSLYVYSIHNVLFVAKDEATVNRIALAKSEFIRADLVEKRVNEAVAKTWEAAACYLHTVDASDSSHDTVESNAKTMRFRAAEIREAKSARSQP